jgi:hypothetical protein
MTTSSSALMVSMTGVTSNSVEGVVVRQLTFAFTANVFNKRKHSSIHVEN